MIICGESLSVMSGFPDNHFDTIITDPPYGINFMGKDWDYGIPGKIYWAEMLRICKPGTTLMAFGGTRTHHRLMVNIEDAGWEIRDCMMWLYGQGFPKSYDISKGIDKAKGEKREDVAIPISYEAQKFDGYGTALKPAWEPIIVAQKSIDKNYVNNALTWNLAGLDIDEGRIGTSDKLGGGGYMIPVSKGWDRPFRHNDELQEEKKQQLEKNVAHAQKLGRYPSNLILSHHPDCKQIQVIQNNKKPYVYKEREYDNKDSSMFNGDKPQSSSNYNDNMVVNDWKCVDDCAVRLLNRQSGNSPSSARPNVTGKQYKQQNKVYGKYSGVGFNSLHNDFGGASRFFYCAKASKSERGSYNNHPTVKPLKIIRYLCRLTRPPNGGIVLDPFMGSGSTLKAALLENRQVIGIDNDISSCKIAALRLNEESIDVSVDTMVLKLKIKKRRLF